MKRILQLLLPLVAFFSCNTGKEKPAENTVPSTLVANEPKPTSKPDSLLIKTGWAIEKYARNDLQQGGYKILSLVIDSLSYSPVSIRDFYSNRKAQIETEREEYRAINIRLKGSGVALNPVKLADDSLKTMNALRELDALIAHADTAKNILMVSYKLVAQTNTTVYNTLYTKYLLEKDLSEMKMKFQGVRR